MEITDAVRRLFTGSSPRIRLVFAAQTTNVLLKSFVNKDPYRARRKTGFTNEAGVFVRNRRRSQSADNVIVVLLGADSTEDRFQK